MHPSVKWAEEDAGVDPDELAKVLIYLSNLACMIFLTYMMYIDGVHFIFQIKIAFVRNLPSSTDENYLKFLFEPFGKVRDTLIYFFVFFNQGT